MSKRTPAAEKHRRAFGFTILASISANKREAALLVAAQEIQKLTTNG